MHLPFYIARCAYPSTDRDRGQGSRRPISDRSRGTRIRRYKAPPKIHPAVRGLLRVRTLDVESTRGANNHRRTRHQTASTCHNPPAFWRASGVPRRQSTTQCQSTAASHRIKPFAFCYESGVLVVKYMNETPQTSPPTCAPPSRSAPSVTSGPIEPRQHRRRTPSASTPPVATGRLAIGFVTPHERDRRIPVTQVGGSPPAPW